MSSFNWKDSLPLPPFEFECTFCAHSVTSALGYVGLHPATSDGDRRIYLCPRCEMPSTVLSNTVVIHHKEIPHD